MPGRTLKACPPGKERNPTTNRCRKITAKHRIPEERRLPEWYKIAEIAPSDFVACCNGIYKVIEHQHKSKSVEDPFLKAVVTGHNDATEDTWRQAEQVRLTQKVLEMKMGDFHEEIMGKLPGYETYPNGHITGCDVGKLDGSEVFEVKNRDNTVKGSDAKHILAMLKRHADNGKLAVFVQVNCPGGKVNRFGASPDVNVWNGRKAYTYLSGRESFFDDLLATVTYCFSEFKTLAELRRSLGTA